MHRRVRRQICGLLKVSMSVVVFCMGAGMWTGDAAGAAPSGTQTKSSKSAKSSPHKSSPAIAVVQQYIEAVASGNQAAAGRLDFACQYRMAVAAPSRLSTFPAESDPVYTACWQSLEQAHLTVVERRGQGMDTIWPGKGALVFFPEDLTRYAPSFFVMDRVGTSPPGSGVMVEVAGTKPLPAVSFRLKEGGPVVAAPATLVTMRVNYKDALTSPVTYAPDAYRWTNTVKRPKSALKSLNVSWVAVTGLKKLGLPGDVAVVNLPVARITDPGGAIPFVTEPGGYVKNSAVWWGAEDAPGLLIASVGRASLLPDLHNRVALLNRVLIIDPKQPDALGLLTRDLYESLLGMSETLHQTQVNDQSLAMRFDQLYWDTYAQTTRTELSLGMEMGGFDKPTPADYLYRLLPAMEMLAKVRPEDLENRIRLGIVYRWNNDQLAAINTHEAVVKEIPASRTNQRARALIELAWSRIAKVAWNRSFDDPNIAEAYKDAEEAYTQTDRPMEKFAAAYTMAYSLLFTPNRDNHAMLERLTEARDWYLKLPGASPKSWVYLLSNDNMKGVVEADPAFQPLMAGGDHSAAQIQPTPATSTQ
ncbi:tetratricopeptide repeat protein [Nitrospira sp. Nam74]